MTKEKKLQLQKERKIKKDRERRAETKRKLEEMEVVINERNKLMKKMEIEAGKLERLTLDNIELKLERDYRHFIGEIGDKNDVSFVAGAWKALLDSNWFNEIKTVKIWSDGGPKHFKISANMKLLLTIQHVTPSVDWWYNFFGAYHGCSVCDGVAAQAKASLINSMRDNQMAIRTSNQAIETIGASKIIVQIIFKFHQQIFQQTLFMESLNISSSNLIKQGTFCMHTKLVRMKLISKGIYLMKL